MSSTPPIPDATPTPLAVSNDDSAHQTGGGEALKVAKELADAKKRWTPNASQIGLGAAIGVGSAAIVAGLLYWRGNKR